MDDRVCFMCRYCSMMDRVKTCVLCHYKHQIVSITGNCLRFENYNNNLNEGEDYVGNSEEHNQDNLSSDSFGSSNIFWYQD